MDRKAKAADISFKRRRGPSPERRAEIARANERFDDWWGKCRRCGQRVQGTLAQLRAHVCEVK